jgi:4-amino-4-deoxy-L-arabinose transferase-like glycosyltransferase
MFELKNLKTNKILLIILISNFILKSLWVMLLPHPPLSAQGDPEEYDILAWNMINHNGYNLQGLGGHFTYFLKNRINEPTARRVPLYPLMIALIYLLVGRHYKAIFLVQSMIDTLVCFLIYLITKKVFDNHKAGLIASMLYFLYIPFLETNHVIMSETLYNFLFYLALLFLIHALENQKLSYFMVSGIILGLAHLTRPTVIYVVFLFIFLILWTFRKKIYIGLNNSLTMLILFLIVISPWIIRNYLVFDRFIYSTSLEGENLAYEFLSSYSNITSSNNNQIAIEEVFNRSGEIGRNDFLLEKAKNFYLTNPNKWFFSIPDHLLILWFGNYKNPKPQILYYATTEKHHSLSISSLVQNLLLLFLSILTFTKYFKLDWFKISLPIIIAFLLFNFTETLVTPDHRHFIPLAPSLIIIGSYSLLNLLMSTRLKKFIV